MSQYGDYLVQSEVMDETTLRAILQENAEQVIVALKVKATPVFYFNLPYDYQDKETGDIVHGFTSYWRFKA